MNRTAKWLGEQIPKGFDARMRRYIPRMSPTDVYLAKEDIDDLMQDIYVGLICRDPIGVAVSNCMSNRMFSQHQISYFALRVFYSLLRDGGQEPLLRERGFRPSSGSESKHAPEGVVPDEEPDLDETVFAKEVLDALIGVLNESAAGERYTRLFWGMMRGEAHTTLAKMEGVSPARAASLKQKLMGNLRDVDQGGGFLDIREGLGYPTTDIRPTWKRKPHPKHPQ